MRPILALCLCLAAVIEPPPRLVRASPCCSLTHTESRSSLPSSPATLWRSDLHARPTTARSLLSLRRASTARQRTQRRARSVTHRPDDTFIVPVTRRSVFAPALPGRCHLIAPARASASRYYYFQRRHAWNAALDASTRTPRVSLFPISSSSLSSDLAADPVRSCSHTLSRHVTPSPSRHRRGPHGFAHRSSQLSRPLVSEDAAAIHLFTVTLYRAVRSHPTLSTSSTSASYRLENLFPPRPRAHTPVRVGRCPPACSRVRHVSRLSRTHPNHGVSRVAPGDLASSHHRGLHTAPSRSSTTTAVPFSHSRYATPEL